MSRRSFLIIAVFCVLALVVGSNVLASYAVRGWRLDLSADKLYTLSEGARAAVADIDEPVDLTFVYSRGLAQDYPQIRAYGARVRETLKGVAAASGGKVRLLTVDPEPFSAEEDAAIAAGLEGADTDAGERLYFGLIARNALDEKVIVPFFNPEREPYLEYEIARAITEVTRPSARRVAVITTLPFETPTGPGQQDARGLYAFNELMRAFSLDILDEDFTVIPPEAEMLVIAHPWRLSPGQTYAVDQFVLRRGRAVVLVDPLSQLSLKPGPTGLPRFDAEPASDLPILLAAWGVRYDPTRVALDRANALTAAIEEEGRVVERSYPLWHLQSPDRMNRVDLVTSPLQTGVTFAASGALAADPGAATTFEPLVSTSDDAVLADVDQVSGGRTPQEVIAEYDAARAETPAQSLVLAARVSGLVGSAFPSGPPAEDVEPRVQGPSATPPGDAAGSVSGAHLADGRIEVVVVADADLLDDAFYVRAGLMGEPTAVGDNANLILNALDVLSGSDALVKLRSRARSGRPMTRVDRLRSEAETRFFEEQATLETELGAAEERLAGMMADGRGTSLFTGEAEVTAEEQAELTRIREVITSTRARLRDVERSFRRDIDALAAWLIFFNVWLMPILVVVAGLIVMRRRGGAGGGA